MSGIMNACSILILLTLLINVAENKRILVIPLPQMAYAKSQEQVANRLISNGHDVTMVLGSKFSEVFKPSNPAIEIITYHQDLYDISTMIPDIINRGERLDGLLLNPLLLKVTDLIQLECMEMCSNIEFITKIKNQNFDVALVDLFPTNPCMLLLPHNLSIPIVADIPWSLQWWIGIPAIPSFVPFPVIGNTDKMNFYERFLNLLVYVVMQLIPIHPSNTTLLQTYAPDITSWRTLMKQCDLFIVSRDHSIDWPQPMMPNTIFIPGKSFSEPKPLPANILTVINKADKGVIIMSFGSLFNSLAPYFINKFIKTFKLLPNYTIIYSYKGDSSKLDTIPPNVFIFDWIPQNDILGHPSVKLFINHGGVRGLSEALYHGVPTLTIGPTREQISNGKSMWNHQYGSTVDFYTFSSEDLYSEIKEVLDNPIYSKKVKHISAILHDGPNPTAIMSYWIEHIAKFGGGHLRPRSLDMPLYEFLMLDIMCFFICVDFIILGLCFLCCRKCRNVIRNEREVKMKIS